MAANSAISGELDQDSSSLGVSVASLGKLFGLTLLVHVFSYLLGYFDFSIAWVLIAVSVFVLREKSHRDKRQMQMSLRCISQNPKQVLARLQDLPSWVHFPDVERAEWLNKIIKQLWPHIGGYVRSFIKEKIEPGIQKSLAKSLRITSFSFESIDLGDTPLRVGGVKVYGSNVSRKEIIMDLDVYYAGDCSFQVSVRRIKAGFKEVQMRGTLRVVLKPLLSKIPLAGGLQVFFLNRPMIDFNLTNAINVLDMPGLADLLRNTVVDQVSEMMVLPNKLSIKLMSDLATMTLEMPEPVGVLRIKVAEAKELMRKDGAFGMGKSDPYAVISVGAEQFRTKVIDNTDCPIWDHYCEVMVYYADGQEIEVDVYDEDPAGDDESLGRLTVDVQTVISRGHYDSWVVLDEAKTGAVHLELSWFTFTQSSYELFKVMKDSHRLKEDLSCAVLIAYVDCAKNLPNSGKVGVEPSPYVRLSMGSQMHETKRCLNTNDPVWENGFCFLVQNPEVQDISVEVVDQKSEKALGAMSVPLRRLLKEPNLTVHRPFRLEDAKTECEITLLLKLQIFHAVKAEESEAHTETSPVGERKEQQRPVSGGSFGSGGQRESPLPSRSSGSVRGGSGRPVAVDSQNGSLETESIIALENESETNLQNSESENSLRRRIVDPGGDSKRPKLQLTMRYSAQRQKLIVVVHRAVNVPCLGSGEAPDPYVKLYLQADQSRDSKRKTASVKSSCKPVYDETFEYTIVPEDLQNHVVEASVCARSGSSLFARSVTLGEVEVKLSGMELNQAITEWYDLEELKAEDGAAKPERSS